MDEFNESIETDTDEVVIYRKRHIRGRKLSLIIIGVVFGGACALILALLPLYLLKNDPARSDQKSICLILFFC